jgi:AP endonuclease-1
MSRRSSRKSDVKALEAHATNIIASPSTTPRKGRKVMKAEDDELLVANTKPARSPNGANVKAEIHAEAMVSTMTNGEVTSVKEEVDIELNQESKPKPKKVTTKRKAKTQEEDAGQEKESATKKKRKTKEEKEAENVPLAARTPIVTLKKSMHIGAHVSGAKGISKHFIVLRRMVQLAYT